MPEFIGTYTVYLKAEADTEEEAIEKIQNLAWSILAGNVDEYHLEEIK